MEEKSESLLTGRVEKITFQNSENGFTVFRVSHDGALTTAVGILPGIREGETLRLRGEWGFHPSFGEQFQVSEYQQTLPGDKASILHYLASGIIKGVGAATASKLVEYFGEDTLQVLEQYPERMSEIKGISPKKAQEIGEEFQRQRSLREVMLSLGQYGMSPSECIHAYHAFGRDAADRILKNPYLLCSSGINLGFLRVDELARGMLELAPENLHRVKAGIVYILKHNLGNGHTCIPLEFLFEPATGLLSVERSLIADAVEDLVEEGRLVVEKLEGREFLFLEESHRTEQDIARQISLMSLFVQRGDQNLSRELEKAQQEQGITYEEVQKEAIETALSKGIFILTGGPGTGKTTTLNGIIRLMEQRGMTVLLAAPTGRAAKRMAQVTGREASTIHRLLEVEWSGEEQHFLRNADNPLKAEAVILDELSMVDIFLFSALLEAIPPGCRLIMVGDSDQLPPVGAGNVLNDLIHSGLLPTVCLKKIFRQSMDSLIVTNAHAIVSGHMPELGNRKSDFFFLSAAGEEAAAELVVSLCADRLPAAYGYSFEWEIQVLCPSRRGTAGTVNLNRLLQQRLNPPAVGKQELRRNSFVLREGDKVMQVKNNYDIPWNSRDGEEGSGIYNGDVGILEKIDLLQDRVTVRFEDRTAQFTRETAADLELAYAVTVHKNQGSEFEAVVMPVIGVSHFLCYRNLLYTGVTRAKRLMILTGSVENVRQMVENNQQGKRYSALRYFLRQTEESPSRGGSGSLPGAPSAYT